MFTVLTMSPALAKVFVTRILMRDLCVVAHLVKFTCESSRYIFMFFVRAVFILKIIYSYNYKD